MNTNTNSPTAESQARLKHPFLLVFLLGGFLGAVANLGVTFLAHLWLGWDPFVSIFVGSLFNQLCHALYYMVVFVQEQGHWRLGPVSQSLIYLGVASLSAGLLWLFLFAGLDFIPAVIGVLVVLSVVNALLVRMDSFSSAQLAEIEYKAMDDSYYDDHTDAAKVGWFRAWFHHSRFVRLTEFVDQHFQPGMLLADLGCGNCWWNTRSLPVTGVDINQNMLSWALKHKRIHETQLCTNLADTKLPDAKFDIVIMSETLEHLLELPLVLTEVRRILKPTGVFLITVPYDFILSPFFILFNIHCFYQGFIRGSEYHKYRCGHINHFSKSRLRELLEQNGFRVKRISVVNGLTLYASAEKINNDGK